MPALKSVLPRNADRFFLLLFTVLRNQTLSLLSQHGPNAYLIRNYQLESQAKELEAELEVWKEKVVEVNRGRRFFQVSAS